jgi:hypothetical protein
MIAAPKPPRRWGVTILVVHHRVRDYASWKPVFDDHQSVRASHGASRHWVYQAPDDPNDVVVAVEFPSPDAARGFMDDPSLAPAMQRAGVEGQPTVHMRVEVEDRTY